MNTSAVDLALDPSLTDETIVKRVIAGETALFEILMRRYNQRLFRVVLAIIDEEDETQDVMQEAYVNAFTHLHQYAGRAKFSTWLTKIAVYEALNRARKRKRLEPIKEGDIVAVDETALPDTEFSRSSLRGFIASELKRLPLHQRLVFTLRDVEQFATTETARCLGVTEQNVKVTLHRARAAIRQGLERRMDLSLQDIHTFGGQHCDAMVTRVLRRTGAELKLV